MAQPGVQALPHQGVPAPQGRGKRPPQAGLESPAHSRQDQLPHPHRCHKGDPHPRRRHQGPGQPDLRQRGGSAQRRSLRPDRETMARRPSRCRGQHSRSRPAGATRRPHQPRKPQLRPHPQGTSGSRTVDQTQRNRHHPDAHPARGYQPQAAQVMMPNPDHQLTIRTSCGRFTDHFVDTNKMIQRGVEIHAVTTSPNGHARQVKRAIPMFR